ncbi:hypothetical protein ACLOJK_005713 [Asimina triloba]
MHSGLGFLLKLGRSASGATQLSNCRWTAGVDLRPSLLRFSLLDGGGDFRGGGRRYLCSGYAMEQFSDDEYECDFESHKASSSVANIDEWKWKLSLLLRSEEDREVISRDKRDRRDYEQISNLAKRMGLHSELYGKVVVASKVPLPNYRPDLDDKRPQREVVIPLSLQRRVEGLLQEHLDRMMLNSEKMEDSLAKNVVVNQNEDVNEDDSQESFLDASESPEGVKMLTFRKSLPSYKEKERLLSAIARNQVVVISGETGCGKTTQLPQYVLESEIESGRGAFCSIICTQPRRISAMAVSERVSAERGENLGETDLLPRRRDLRLILMSATLNADATNYLKGKNKGYRFLVNCPWELGDDMTDIMTYANLVGFTYPVRPHFLEDILETTGYKMTSFNQIDDYGQEKTWKTQRQLLPRKRKNQITTLVEDALNNSNFENYSSRTRDSLACWTPDSIGFNLIEAVLCHICRKERPGAVLVFMTGWDDISCLRDQLKAHPLLGDPNRVLLLTCHGSMATSEQKLIFEKPPPNVRKIVLATNMAEASITINDVVFVVDCGKAKETTYDALNNTPCLLPSWISKASARQIALSIQRVIASCFTVDIQERTHQARIGVFLRRGRAGRVQPGECYHLYPRCVYDAFADYQLPELLRTPLNSLCLQIKSLHLGSIGQFLSAALQPPEPLAVQNAVDFLKMIGALDEEEKLTNLGKYLSMLPVDPKLGKMLIMGSVFRCLDPILTVVSGLSLAGTAKSRFSAKDYSDHMALVRAYEGWKDAEREGSAYEYCWRNFLSTQTLQAIHSLRKQFQFILKDAGLIDADSSTCNNLSHNQSLVRAIICSGLFPGIASVVFIILSLVIADVQNVYMQHREKSMSFKTMDDGQILLYANSVNARYQTIIYPWLVFGEKVKVNAVFIRDSTGVSDSILILFGGSLSRGALAGHLKMLDGYIDFFMDPSLAELCWNLKAELDKIIQMKLQDPSIEIQKVGKYLLLAVQELIAGDQCEGRFVFGRQSKKAPANSEDGDSSVRLKDGTNPKNLLQTLLMRAGHSPPKYKTKHLKTNEFRALVEFKGMQFVGKPKKNKQLAERDAAIEALAWLTHTSDRNGDEETDVTDNMLKLLGRDRRRKLLVVGFLSKLSWEHVADIVIIMVLLSNVSPMFFLKKMNIVEENSDGELVVTHPFCILEAEDNMMQKEDYVVYDYSSACGSHSRVSKVSKAKFAIMIWKGRLYDAID